MKNNLQVACVRSSHQRCSIKKGVLRNFAKFTEKHLCQSLFLNKVSGLKPASFIKKETLAQVFSCEFCEISTNTFSYKTPLVTASVLCQLLERHVSYSKNETNQNTTFDIHLRPGVTKTKVMTVNGWLDC